MEQRERPRDPHSTTLTASEVGRYVYCARAWWLQRVRGHAPENAGALQRGTQRHQEHGRAVAHTGRQRALAYVFLALAFGLATFLVLTLLRI
jgi:hypothetical protein